MKLNKISLVITLGIISILIIIFGQVYWLNKTYEIKEQQFNESIFTALNNVVEKMSPESVSNEGIIKQISSDYFVVNVNDVINANVLYFYLRSEFEKLQILLDFEYAIYDCANDKMVYGGYVKIEEGIKIKNTFSDLKTYDDYIYYFGIKFPTKSSYVIKNMRLSIVFPVILAFAIIFFGYALYLILQQKRRSELQTDFINNMTHEFKTPIASIGLASDVMLKNNFIKEDARLLNYMKIIKEQNERLNLQVEKVLQIAKNQNNSLHLIKETIDIKELLEKITRNCAINYLEKNGKLNFHSDLENVYIKADRTHLCNIFYNILDNSLKYCKKIPIVDIHLTKKDNIVTIKIKDNGIGIDKKYLSQIFDKFFRIPTGNIHNIKGFGLGLFYVKNVIDQHGWKIKINSKENSGTEIIIQITT